MPPPRNASSPDLGPSRRIAIRGSSSDARALPTVIMESRAPRRTPRGPAVRRLVKAGAVRPHLEAASKTRDASSVALRNALGEKILAGEGRRPARRPLSAERFRYGGPQRARHGGRCTRRSRRSRPTRHAGRPPSITGESGTGKELMRAPSPREPALADKGLPNKGNCAPSARAHRVRSSFGTSAARSRGPTARQRGALRDGRRRHASSLDEIGDMIASCAGQGPPARACSRASFTRGGAG